MSTPIARLYNFVNDKNSGVPITASRVDAELNQLVTSQNRTCVASATAPSSPEDGDVWVDTANNYVKWYNNDAWTIVGSSVDDIAISGTATINESLKLTETTAPTTAASEGALYTKDTSGQPELFFREESSGDEVQLTSGGRPNPVLGTFTSISATTIYQATEGDLFIVGVRAGSAGTIIMLTGDNSDLEDVVGKYDCQAFDETGGNYGAGATLIVPKNYYYCILCNNLFGAWKIKLS